MIKKILEYLSKIFKTNKKDIVINAPVEIPEEFKYLEFGDLIFADRFDNEKERYAMGEEHSRGPFIVIEKDEDKLICIYCSSSPKGYEKRLLENNYESLYKETYYSLARIKTINIDQYLYSLDEKIWGIDLERVKKDLYFKSDVSYDDNNVKKKLNIEIDTKISKGDIISYKKRLLLILDESENNYIVIRVYDPRVKRNIINFNSQSFDFSNIELIDKNSNFSYLMTISQKQFDIINKKKELYEKEKERISLVRNNNGVDRGFLIKKDGILYYVYSINKDIANAFRCGVIEKETSSSFKINNIILRPHYERKSDLNRFDKNINIIEIATNDEMDIISEKRKAYKEQNKPKKLPKNKENKQNNNYLIGKIINNKNMPGLRYLIISANKEELQTLHFDAFIYADKIFITNFDRNNTVFSTCKDVTKEEKWLLKSKLQSLDINVVKEKTKLN